VDISAHAAFQRPMIGILTMDEPKEMFRGNRNNFIDIIRTGSEMGVPVCVVTVKDLRLKGNKMIGYTYDLVTKSWRRQTISLPHVLYNRIPQREDEAKPEVQLTLKACLKHPQVRLFNPSFFNKWSLFEWLSKGKTTAKYIPLTRKLTSSSELESMLKTHRAVYMKPVSGKAGKGIMKAERVSVKSPKKTEYLLSIQEAKGGQVLRFAKMADMWEKIKEEIGNEVYIAQKAIPIVKHKNRPFDLRLLVQKDYNGRWDITGIGARLAGKMSITTHVPRGGSIDDPERLLSSTFGTEGAKRILARARKAALAIARQVERKSGQMLGEMSMDMGVDVHGGIWFFEANSKPMKFDEAHIRKKSLERIIHYSLYLIRQKNARNGGIGIARAD